MTFQSLNAIVSIMVVPSVLHAPKIVFLVAKSATLTASIPRPERSAKPALRPH